MRRQVVCTVILVRELVYVIINIDVFNKRAVILNCPVERDRVSPDITISVRIPYYWLKVAIYLNIVLA